MYLNDLKIVLDYVERWNKNDAEIEVAEASQRLEIFLTDPGEAFDKMFEGTTPIDIDKFFPKKTQ